MVRQARLLLDHSRHELLLLLHEIHLHCAIQFILFALRLQTFFILLVLLSLLDLGVLEFSKKGPHDSLMVRRRLVHLFGDTLHMRKERRHRLLVFSEHTWR